jgi:excisionase family DNA binding protein
MQPVSPYMTREEAAEYLRVQPRTVDKYVRRGDLTRYKRGHSVLLARDEVVTFVKIDEHVGERQPEKLIEGKRRSLAS